MKMNVVVISAAIAAISVACTKSKSSDPAPAAPVAPAPQGNTTTPPTAAVPAATTTTTEQQQQQWQQQQQQSQQMTTTQTTFNMRFATSMVGEPGLEITLFPNMKDAQGKEIELPYVEQHILGANGAVLVTSGSKVWGKVLLQQGGQSIFTAGGFLLPSGQQYATNGTGLVTSADSTKFDWATTGWNVLKGSFGGAAVGTIISMTTGDKKIQAWEVAAGAGGGALLMGLLSAISSGNRDPLVTIYADSNQPVTTVYLNIVDATKVTGYKAPPTKGTTTQTQK
jgi:hypothetical protein